MKIIILLTIFVIISIDICYGKILRSSPLSNLCPKYLTYNKNTNACEVEIPPEFDNIDIDKVAGYCINGECPKGLKCIDKIKFPFCGQHFTTVQEANDYYNDKEL
uniref:Secreted protein n=1 Tax=Strongyloides stercoralis TaxID=6248 RepID=A0A0K0ER91_STRER